MMAFVLKNSKILCDMGSFNSSSSNFVKRAFRISSNSIDSDSGMTMYGITTRSDLMSSVWCPCSSSSIQNDSSVLKGYKVSSIATPRLFISKCTRCGVFAANKATVKAPIRIRSAKRIFLKIMAVIALERATIPSAQNQSLLFS